MKPRCNASSFVAAIFERVLLASALTVAILVPLRLSAQAPSTAPQPAGDPFHRVTLVDNPRVLVERLTLQPGQRTDPPGKTHTDPRDVAVVQLTPGDIFMNTGETSDAGHQDAGKVWWISTPHRHSLANLGTAPFDIITVHLKEPASTGTPPAASAPTPAALAAAANPTTVNFMQRVVKLDNERVIAYLESEQIGQRTDPPGRTHPDQMDGVVIMMTPGNIEFNTGEKVEVGHQEIGKTWWMPKPPFTHSLANYGFTRNDPGGPFTFMVVSLKNR
jgi:hypothetical protein